MKAKKYWILLLVLFVECSLHGNKCLAAKPTVFHSEANGYFLKIPEGWIKIPDNIMHTTLDLLLSKEGQSEIVFETVFQREVKGLWFQYPYTIVQVLTYSSFGLDRQINESEFKNYVKALSGLDITDYIERALTPIGQEVGSEYAIGKVYLDSNKKLYVFGVEMEEPSVGKIKGQAVGHFGRRAIIQVMFYDLESNWSQSKPERDLILGSFQFDPAMAYRGPTRKALDERKKVLDEMRPIEGDTFASDTLYKAAGVAAPMMHAYKEAAPIAGCTAVGGALICIVAVYGIFRSKASVAMCIAAVLVVLAFVLTIPGFTRYWYRAGVGHSICVQVEMLEQLNPGFNIDDRSDPQREQIGNRAKQEGVKCAILMLGGEHIPLCLLALITIGILTRSASTRFKRRLKIAYPLVCLWGALFLSIGTTYWVMAAPFPESLGPAILIWLVIAGFFSLIIGLFKLITFLSRPEEKSGDEQKQQVIRDRQSLK